MANTIDTILKICGSTNPKGMKQFVYASIESNINTIPDADAGTLLVSTAITMEDAEVFYKWEISPNEQKFDVNSEGDADSNSKISDIEFFIPGITHEKSYILGTNSNGCALIFVVPDKAGNLRIVGEKGDGATMLVKEQLLPKPGYVVTLKYESALPPLFYAAAVPT